MAKRRNPNQASFFKAEIPEMPEGYYSSGPNPNERRFVEEHAKPYNPTKEISTGIDFAALIAAAKLEL